MITCVVVYPEGLTNPVVVEWYDSNGLLSSENAISVSDPLMSEANITSVLEFNPFRIAHAGQFSCRATFMSQAPPFNISKTSEIDIIVGSKFAVMFLFSNTDHHEMWYSCG